MNILDADGDLVFIKCFYYSWVFIIVFYCLHYVSYLLPEESNLLCYLFIFAVPNHGLRMLCHITTSEVLNFKLQSHTQISIEDTNKIC